MGKWKLPPGGGHMESPNGLYLQTMNMTQVNERLKKNDLIIIPVGSTECHGAAQPLGEDTFLVTRMAEQVAMKTGCTIAMPICGMSFSHPLLKRSLKSNLFIILHHPLKFINNHASPISESLLNRDKRS